MNKAVSVFCIILGAILLCGMVFGVFVLLDSTNYFTTTPTNFYVVADGVRYYAGSNELIHSETKIEVHYLVEWLTKKQGYSYKIVPAGEDFEFVLDGNVCNFLDIEDLTPAFEITERSQSLAVKVDKKINNVLSDLYPGRKVAILGADVSIAQCNLLITSVDGKVISFTFSCDVDSEDDGSIKIELDPPAIVF